MDTFRTICSGRLSSAARMLFFCSLLIFSAALLPAAELRLMPAPPTPEADYGEEGTGGFDVGVGYAHGWLKGNLSASMKGLAAGTVYRGVIARKIGFTAVPLSASWVTGKIEGYGADMWSLGSGFSAGSRVFGSADSYNAVLFGGGVYGWNLDQRGQALGDYRYSAHFFGFTAGAKFQIAPAERIRIIPFYVYMGGGGRFSLESDFPPIDTKGGLGYVDHHLLGLDFNIYGVTAKFVADLFGEDYGSFTVTVEIRRTVRSVKTAAAEARND